MKLKRMFMGLIMTLIYLLTICINVSAYGEISKKADLTISNLKELIAFRDNVNKGYNYIGKTIKLLKDIDMSSIDNWEPIGSTEYKMFAGTFDGGNRTVCGLNINNYSDGVGLFGYAYANETCIKNLNIKNVNITSSGNFVGSLIGDGSIGAISNCTANNINIISNGNYIGGLIGKNISIGEISNCTITNATINGKGAVGGIVGGFSGTKINNCSSSAVVIGEIQIGGLAGFTYGGAIDKSNSTGDVSGENRVGGLVGCGRGMLKITNSFATSNISGKGCLGGLIGQQQDYPTISDKSYFSNCYSTGDVTGQGTCGGFIGYGRECYISNCYSTGNVSNLENIKESVGMGGFASVFINSDIVNCYSKGDASCSHTLGGFVSSNSQSNIINCYSSGTVSGENRVGGFSGFTSYNVNYVNSYFNCNSIQNAVGFYVDNSNTSGTPLGKSLTSMKNQSFASELSGPIPEDIAKVLKENNITVYKYNWKQGENNNLPFIDSTLPY